MKTQSQLTASNSNKFTTTIEISKTKIAYTNVTLIKIIKQNIEIFYKIINVNVIKQNM